MTKANDRRVKMSLEQTRQALKAESLDLEKRRREYGRERELVVAALRLLTGRYGDDSWTDETPLPTVLEHHLARPLERQLAEVRAHVAGLEARLARDGARTSAVRSAPTPTPLRPTVVPPTTHKVLVVPAELRGERGFRANCTCGWRSPLWQAEDGALVGADTHLHQVGERPVSSLRSGAR